MNVSTAIQERRAEKMFDPAFTISEQEVNDLLEKAMLSPTDFNIQNWRIVNVKDSALRQNIREVAWNHRLVAAIHPEQSIFLLAHGAQRLKYPPVKKAARIRLLGQDVLIDRIPLGAVRQPGIHHHRIRPVVRRGYLCRHVIPGLSDSGGIFL